jgi:hypothetical protein
MTSTGLRLVLAVGLCCCSSTVDRSGPVLPAGWCRSHFCDKNPVLYTAVGEGIYDELSSALARLKSATGRDDLGTDPQAGIPVSWDDTIDDCGQTIVMGPSLDNMYAQRILLSQAAVGKNCPEVQETLVHELIHAMAPDATHAISGIFAPSSQSDKIDSLALDKLCSQFDCDLFNPELP